MWNTLYPKTTTTVLLRSSQNVECQKVLANNNNSCETATKKPLSYVTGFWWWCWGIEWMIVYDQHMEEDEGQQQQRKMRGRIRTMGRRLECTLSRRPFETHVLDYHYCWRTPVCCYSSFSFSTHPCLTLRITPYEFNIFAQLRRHPATRILSCCSAAGSEVCGCGESVEVSYRVILLCIV